MIPRPPAQLNLRGRVVEVYGSDDPKLIDRSNDGEISVRRGSIVYRTGLTARGTATIVLHELMHSWLAPLDEILSEKQVEAICEGVALNLFDTIERNPTLLDYLKGVAAYDDFAAAPEDISDPG